MKAQSAPKKTAYQARMPDADGHIAWSEQENATWRTLMERQVELLPGRVCQEYLDGMERLALPVERIPQLAEVDAVLREATGWETAQVPALIPFDTFFELLASRRFPVATFIRTPEELDYLQEPDIFHEIFGHCPMLTNPAFAEFTATYGRLGLEASPKERVYLARLYWMTVELGLVARGPATAAASSPRPRRPCTRCPMPRCTRPSIPWTHCERPTGSTSSSPSTMYWTAWRRCTNWPTATS